MAEGRTLFDLIALSSDLADSLGAEVDVVTEASFRPTCVTVFSGTRLRLKAMSREAGRAIAHRTLTSSQNDGFDPNVAIRCRSWS
jgi:hypothetical protein